MALAIRCAIDSRDIKCFSFGVIIGLGVYKLWSRIRENVSVLNSKPNENDCVFFTPKKITCTKMCNKNYEWDYSSPYPCNECSRKKLAEELQKAEKNLDVCLYLITQEDMCAVLVKMLKKGVYVRIILDKEMSFDAFGNKVHYFRKEHIPLKLITTSYMMHNKFVIVDNKRVITGSPNWTRYGFIGNYENLLFLNDVKIAKKYCRYFEYLWTMKEH